MTYKEAKEIIDKVISDADKIPYYIDAESKVGKALIVAREALEKADEYKWHDLRKNPEDLPRSNGKYLVWRPHFYDENMGEITICYFDGTDTWHDSYGVDFTRVLNRGDISAWKDAGCRYGLPADWSEE